MQRVFGCWFRHSELITADAYKQLLQSSTEILEQDQHGIKVVRLSNGDILKTFRVKHLISSARFFSYARSFCRNAERLKILAVPTVQIKHLYHFKESTNTVVIYQPLVGETVKHLLDKKMLTEELAEKLGKFIADLHDSGVYFRGLHLGNIVLTPTGDFGLIDISEMSIFPWRLGCRRRLRNFARFWRAFEDKFSFGYSGIHALIKGYHASCNKVDMKLKEIEKRLL
ncbi:MAG TPA: toluene tolerance protein [Methylophilaceae bacterium]|nr:toluene tolerance protein [Methylophilaceae bacterium]